MRGAAILGVSIIALFGGVGSAQAAPDARNPFHCGVALSVAYDLARQEHGEDSPLTEELRDRYVFQAMRSAMMPHMTPSEEEADELRHFFAGTPKAGLAMANNCIKRQDVDPRFLATRPSVPLPGGMQGVQPAYADKAAMKAVFASVQAPAPVEVAAVGEPQ
jgi:hypothetical protein